MFRLKFEREESVPKKNACRNSCKKRNRRRSRVSFSTDRVLIAVARDDRAFAARETQRKQRKNVKVSPARRVLLKLIVLAMCNPRRAHARKRFTLRTLPAICLLPSNAE